MRNVYGRNQENRREVKTMEVVVLVEVDEAYGHSVMKALSGKHFSAVQTISNEEIIQDLFIMRDCRMLTLNIITLNLWIWSA